MNASKLQNEALALNSLSNFKRFPWFPLKNNHLLPVSLKSLYLRIVRGRKEGVSECVSAAVYVCV